MKSVPGVSQTWILCGELLSRHKFVLRQVYSLVLIQFGIAGIGFLTRVSVANELGLQAFGELAFAVAIGTYCQTFVQYGLEKSLVRELVHFPHRTGELIKASLFLRLGLFLLLALGLLMAFLLVRGPAFYSLAMLPAFLATVLGAFQLQGLFDACKEMRHHALIVTAERGIYFVLVWCAIAVPLFDLSLARIGCFMLIAVLFGLGLQYRWAWRRLDFREVTGVVQSTQFIAGSSMWIWLAALSSLSIEYANQIVLRCRAGNAELGGFSAAWILVHLATLILNQVGRVGAESAARYSRGDKSNLEQARFLIKYMALMSILGVLVGLPCLCFSRAFVNVFHVEFASAADLLKVLSLYPMFYGPYLAVLQYVICNRLEKTYFSMITVVGLISLGLATWLIPTLHSTGAAISVVVSIGIALFSFSATAAVHLCLSLDKNMGNADQH